MELKNFIVPIDFSGESLNGLKMAMLFGKKRPVNIQMVYVQKTSADYFQPGYHEEEKNWATKKFEKIVKEFTPKLENDSKLKYIIKSGKIYKEVVNQVESYSDAMVVASTHGASGFEEFFLGSNAYKIISATNKPVITIRKGEVPHGISKIVMTLIANVDTRQKVPITAEIAELFGAEIHVITVSSSKSSRVQQRLDAYARQAIGYLNAKKIKHYHKSFVGDNLADLSVVYASSIDADMISIMKQQGKSLNVFLGNYAQQVMNKATIPVLSISVRETHIATGFVASGG